KGIPSFHSLLYVFRNRNLNRITSLGLIHYITSIILVWCHHHLLVQVYCQCFQNFVNHYFQYPGTKCLYLIL
uniref:Uncharacterized protein n=1 Tax=Ciona intestinalis TaxID=7719 RepID=H2XJM0_CIOIN